MNSGPNLETRYCISISGSGMFHSIALMESSKQ